jgi:hypothetical protein
MISMWKKANAFFSPLFLSSRISQKKALQRFGINMEIPVVAADALFKPRLNLPVVFAYSAQHIALAAGQAVNGDFIPFVLGCHIFSASSCS